MIAQVTMGKLSRHGRYAVVLMGCLGVLGCGGDDGTGLGEDAGGAWTSEELALLRELAIDRLPMLAPDPSNRHGDDPRAAQLGERLFFDSRLSGNGAVSCGTCHVPTLQFQDGLPLGQGLGTTGRRTMPVAATAHNTWQFWDGRRDSQWSQALAPLESAVEHGTTRLRIAWLLAEHYPGEYTTIFGALPDLTGLPPHAGPVADPALAAAWQAIPAERQDAINRAFANFGKAIAAFERRIGYGPNRFDRHVMALTGGSAVPAPDRLTADEQAGARLFVGKGKCIECHNGPLLSDQNFHNLAVPPAAGLPVDDGRWAGLRAVREDPFNCLGRYSDAAPGDCPALQGLAVDDPLMLGAFKTPSLRNVAVRAPYMHAGQLATLEEVVDHYDRAPAASRGTSELVPLQLSSRESAQLVAFLKALTGPVEVSVGPH